METSVMQKPEFKQIEKEANNLQVKSDKIQIVDDQTRQEAAKHLVVCSTYIARMEPVIDRPRSIAYEAYLEIQNWKKGVMDRIIGPKETIAAKIGAWDFSIQEKRREEARRDEEKARARAQAERVAEIAAARKAKDDEAVKALKDAPVIVVPTAPKTQEPTKVQGVSTRFEWRLESVFNPAALPREFLMPDERAIKARIKSLGGSHGIPGVKAVQVPIVSGRA